MKVNKLAVLVGLALSAGVTHAVVSKPQPFVEKTEMESVEFCKIFPLSPKCKEDTDGGNGGGNRPPQ